MRTGPLPVEPLPLPPLDPQAARSTPARAAEVAATAARRMEGLGFLVEDMNNLLGEAEYAGHTEVRRGRAEGMRARRLW